MTCLIPSDEEARMIELLEVAGVGCLAVFAAFVWPPAALLVVGAALLVIAYTNAPGGES
jgi:hypothetical protein